MKYLILFLSLFASQLLSAQCCEFEVEYNIQLMKVPEMNELELCFERKSCDLRYYFLGKMVHAIRNSDADAADRFFEQLITIFDDAPTYDPLHYKIINLYADHLNARGEGNLTLAYYRFMCNQLLQNDFLQLIASLNAEGINNNQEGVLKELNKFNALPENSTTAEQKMIYFLRASSNLDHRKEYELLKQHSTLHRSASKEQYAFLYMLHLHSNFSSFQDPEAERIWSELKQSNFSPQAYHFAHKWVITRSNELLNDGKYDEALQTIKHHIEGQVGSFDSADELLEVENISTRIPPITLTGYARKSLFQTSLGKGLPPVIDAFNIYEFVYHNRIDERSKHLNSIVSENDITQYATPHDILVVGTYLYQKTQEIQYLNRTYYVINGMNGGSVSYWTKARALMRENDAFQEDLAEEQRLTAAIRKTDKDDTLREIFDRQSALHKHRKNTESKYRAFHQDLIDSYKIDLHELQDKMRQDTAACLDFFLDAQMLYRFYVSPDTIDIFPIDDAARVESLKLTEQLAQMVASGKSAETMKPASRELFGHLFKGIEDELPPKLHIIANGKLLDIPFSVLRKDEADEAPRYLGVEHAISRQFSLSTMLLLEDTKLSPSNDQPLAMAPSFSNEFLQASELRQAGFQLPPLVYNTEELNDLQSRGSGKYLYDNDATIASYRDQVADYNIVHLATHAISSKADGLRSRVYLLDDAGEPVGLYAGDIGEQTLNSELVVLSACETGSGGIHYVEGRVGLTKAYLAAGARSVVASNWAVDDHATAEQMKTFYDGIEAGQAPHVALQGARRAYLEAHPDAPPYKWAAFEAYGGMGPVRWDKDAGKDYWWWLALPVLGLGTVVVWKKRRRARRAA